ncbi:hypothetical protein HH874_000493, partial [Escherichia coli]|nr:hypothetical protein [Escherichia coli]
DKMHKDQYTDDSSLDQVRVKTMLTSTISMSYPDVVIACIFVCIRSKINEFGCSPVILV